MDQKSGSDPIRDYILANRDRYTRDAIREQLIAAGHKAEDVDRIWEALGPTEERPSSRFTGLAIFALVLLVIGAAIGAFGGFLIASLNASYSGSDTGVVRFFLVYAAIYLVTGSIMVWVANRIRVSDTVQFVLGVLLIPVYIGLMFGTCVAAVNLTS
jgi:hypothetical protein